MNKWVHKNVVIQSKAYTFAGLWASSIFLPYIISKVYSLLHKKGTSSETTVVKYSYAHSSSEYIWVLCKFFNFHLLIFSLFFQSLWLYMQNISSTCVQDGINRTCKLLLYPVCYYLGSVHKRGLWKGKCHILKKVFGSSLPYIVLFTVPQFREGRLWKLGSCCHISSLKISSIYVRDFDIWVHSAISGRTLPNQVHLCKEKRYWKSEIKIWINSAK